MYTKYIFLPLGVGVLVILSGYWYTTRIPSQSQTYTFACASDKTIRATFHTDKDPRVDLVLNNGDTDVNWSFSLPQVISASGAKYANSDDSMIFWTRGDTAFIQDRGNVTYTDCITTQ